MSSENFFESNNEEKIIAPENAETPKTEVVNDYEVHSNVSKKSRLIALLLGIFLGSLGVHNFYLGKIAKGVVQCVLTVFGYIVYVAAMFSFVAMTGFNADSAGYLTEEETMQLMQKVMIPMVTCLTLLSITGIWSFIEWVMIAAGAGTDKEGKLVKNWN